MLFTFGLDVSADRFVDADDLAKSAWQRLIRPPRYVPKGTPRARRERYKQKVVDERQFNDIRLKEEWVAEMKYHRVLGLKPA